MQIFIDIVIVLWLLALTWRACYPPKVDLVGLLRAHIHERVASGDNSFKPGRLKLQQRLEARRAERRAQ